MFWPPRPLIQNMPWNYHRPPHNPQWRHPRGPRAPFRGQHEGFNKYRPQFQSGNDNFWCETCDRGFPTEDILSQHIQQHQKCNIDGCQFVAHPKVITKHIQMQHSSGLYHKIANINKPEEINKWREERRKKYPTKSNIDKKAAEIKEKIDRGEKMALERNRNRFMISNIGYNKDDSPGHGLKRKNNMGNENQPRSKFKRDYNSNNNRNKKQPSIAAPKTLPVVEENRKLKPFTGIQNLQIDSDNENEDTTDNNMQSIDIIDDDDCEEHKIIELKPVHTGESVVCGALSSLMFDYGSSGEDSEEIVNKIDIKVGLPECKLDNNNICTGHVQQMLKQVAKTNESDSLDVVMKCEATLKKGCNYSDQDKVHSQNTDHTQNLDKDDNGVIKCETEIKKEHTDSGQDTVPENTLNVEKDDYGVIKCLVKIKNECIDSAQDTVHTQNNVNEDDNDSGPEEVKAVVKKEDVTLTGPVTKPKGIRRNKSLEKKHIFQQRKPRMPSTLLQKLLFKEIQHERNIVLQCIRYIRKNNFFDKKE